MTQMLKLSDIKETILTMLQDLRVVTVVINGKWKESCGRETEDTKKNQMQILEQYK